MRKCKFCNRDFQPIRITQIICGDIPCRKGHLSIYQKEWYEKNKEKVREYYLSNKEKLNENL